MQALDSNWRPRRDLNPCYRRENFGTLGNAYRTPIEPTERTNIGGVTRRVEYHRLPAKHLEAYLEEMRFRFSRRGRLNIFVDTLRHMITADPLTFENLTEKLQ